MKKILLLLLIFPGFPFLSKALVLSGTITSNTSLNGKINIVADVTVAAGITLTFEQGSALIFEEGVSLIALQGAHLQFNGTSGSAITISPRLAGTFSGKIECNGANSSLEMHHVFMQGGHINIISGGSAILEDSYFKDFYKGDIPIIRTEAALDFQMRRCMVSNYYELNMISTLTLIEDCVFQFMTADGIDLDNSPAGCTIRRTTVRYGRGTNIDAIDFGKVDFMGSGSIGLIQNCLIHDISDKGVSVGEGAQEVIVQGSVFYNCGAGVAVKDNSLARIYNNTFVNNEVAIELVEKNPGLGGGHGFTYNNILWDNDESFYMNSTSTVEITFSDIENFTTDSLNGIISTNPLFVNAADFDFRLREQSPAIGAGFAGQTLGAIFPVGATFPKADALHLGIPNSFSVYSAGDTIAISWSALPSISTVKLSFSDNNGSSWQAIATGLNSQNLFYAWYAPASYSSKCKIRIESESNSTVFSENYLPFSIIPLLNDSFSPVFSLAAGYYNTEQFLSLNAEPGDIIYYSLDGSDPSDQSLVYTGPLHLRFDSIPAGQSEQRITATQGPHQPYSYIRTAPTSQIGPNPAFWYMPVGTIFKASVVKARVYRPGVGLGPVQTKSYFLDPRMLNDRYTLPVVSLVSDPENLFDYYKGIYIPGVDFTGYSFTGNYERKGRASEMPAHIEYFNTNGREEFSQNIGFRIRGEWIRSTGQKALTIYARSEYDTNNEFDYELFPGLMKPGTHTVQNKYKRFILRNAGNEWGYQVNSMCRDMLNQSLFDRLDVKYQAGSSCVVFLNGEYWGIQNIRELNDRRGLEFSYGVEPDSIIMMEDNLNGAFQLIEGNDADVLQFHSMRDFILNNDLSNPTNYTQVTEKMDVENFIDYWIATIYSNKKNTDHNTSYWKYRNGHPGQGGKDVFDGRWRWMTNDFDNGFDDPSNNNLAWMIYIMKDSLLKRMVTSPVFYQSFLSRFSDLLNSSFSSTHVLKQIDYYHQLLEPEMPEHIARWRTPSDMANWETALNNFRYFAEHRPDYQFAQIKSWFGIPNTFKLEVDVSNQIMGSIQVNTLKINPSLPGVASTVYPWTGTYLESIPTTITAFPYAGYRFVKWKETGESNQSITVNLQADTKRTAVFELDPSQLLGKSDIYPNPVSGSEIHLITRSQVSIFSLDGKEVLRTDSPVLSVNIDALAKGIYIVRLDGAEGIRLVKL
ncbi:MAG: T9SS type A sorting domain-containing protein [Bacteroidetes bacterium]|nr:MAG: T9SS type A sorting domain-containing protein [Bacteroidota bacterium]